MIPLIKLTNSFWKEVYGGLDSNVVSVWAVAEFGPCKPLEIHPINHITVIFGDELQLVVSYAIIMVFPLN